MALRALAALPGPAILSVLLPLDGWISLKAILWPPEWFVNAGQVALHEEAPSRSQRTLAPKRRSTAPDEGRGQTVVLERFPGRETASLAATAHPSAINSSAFLFGRRKVSPTERRDTSIPSMISASFRTSRIRSDLEPIHRRRPVHVIDSRLLSRRSVTQRSNIHASDSLSRSVVRARWWLKDGTENGRDRRRRLETGWHYSRLSRRGRLSAAAVVRVDAA